MSNKIEELYKVIDAKDKIINEQVLEIARLNEEIAKWEEENTRIFDILDNTRIELYNKNAIINKAIEYIKDCTMGGDYVYADNIDPEELLEILGDKEND